MPQSVRELTVDEVIQINRQVCALYNQSYQLLDRSKLESALRSGAFYRDVNGRYIHGGVLRIAGALCYKIAQSQVFMDGNKRTAAISTKEFLAMNGFELRYPKGALVDLILDFAEPQGAPACDIDGAKNWFEVHSFLKPQMRL